MKLILYILNPLNVKDASSSIFDELYKFLFSVDTKYIELMLNLVSI